MTNSFARFSRWGLALAVALSLLPAATAHAQWDLGVRGGYYTDTEELFVGAEALTQFGPPGLHFNPNVELVFLDPGDLLTLNGDFHYDFWRQGDWNAWAGAGPAVVFRDFDGRDETDFGANLLVGIGMRAGAARPYIQGKVLISDETEAVIGVGLRFF